MAMQPIACMAALDTAIASAPSASAFAEIGGFPQTARDNERNVAPAGCIEVTPCPGESRDRWYRDIVPEDNGSGAGTAATAVEDDVIDPDIKRSIDIFFYVLLCCAVSL